jgi:hypothetical protein
MNLRPEERRLITAIDEYTLQKAQDQIVSCEACTPDESEMLFDDVLDRLTGSDLQTTDYVLKMPARCPRCQSAVQTGRWNWVTGPEDDRHAWIVPGTLVVMRDK